MRRCTSHTGSSPLWYSTSSTPNSVVPSPKRAILAREWRSTASNARARTTHSCNGTSARLGDGFMTPWEPPRGERSEEHTSELQSRLHLVCRLLLEKKNTAQPPVAGVPRIEHVTMRFAGDGADGFVKCRRPG